jgi:hypothetical protein
MTCKLDMNLYWIIQVNDFVENRLFLNIDKTNVIKFNLNHLQDYSLQIPYKTKKPKKW